MAGTYPLELVSVVQGRADPALAPNVSVTVVLDSVGPLSGSLAGGQLIAFTGVGLKGLPCSDVLLNGLACSEPLQPPYAADRLLLEQQQAAALLCAAPAVSGFNAADPNSWPSTSAAEVTLRQPESEAATVRASFTYATSATPVLTSVTPSFYSSALSTTVMLNGSASERKWRGAKMRYQCRFS